MISTGPEPLLTLKGLTKSFGTFKANDAVDLEIFPGEIHALLGENGAGKSTFVKMLYGALQPDAGEMIWRGKAVTIPNPAYARQLGIGMVFQHFSLFEALTVAENVAVALPGDTPLKKVAADLEAVSREYGLPLKAGAHVHDLSVGERQRIEIVRCLLGHPDLVIMDEPTSVLTPQEVDDLFTVLRQLASEGKAILYISHKLEEVRALCERATILRQGKIVGTCIPREETAASIAKMMVGADIHQIRPSKARSQSAQPVLSIRGLSMDSREVFGTRLKDVNLDLYPGEIVGIAGIAGNGQSELFDVISGERLAGRPEQVMLFGHPAGHEDISARRARGAVFISEERLGHATVPTLSLSENVILTRYRVNPGLKSGLFLNRGLAKSLLGTIVEKLDVRKSAEDPAAQSLSGGNLQKFIIGREVLEDPKLIIVNQPTWGVDAGSAARIRQTLVDLAESGAAILVISQDLDELFEFTDRLAAIAEGQLSAFEPVAETNRNAIGLKMSGAFSGVPA
ncbi:ABC transporter ATP-binding protein [Pelagibacterium luteolum]|uniref:Simple sugar transport system ATP-binding protein n=1 Tax=Pelagibacterium luteolum TaxID=440168 RepID=A0A1G7UUD3_9HYPH|nr:ABC transporter ATP-binding protein [Pelagibacterium luteolum]SDG50891.1 simple sugar transport system ATP-binding protein [Pelagibacterium luteolum]